MKPSRRTVVVGVACLAVAAGAAGAAVAAGGDDDGDQQARGPVAQRARDAALSLYPGATVTGIERDVEGARVWEVEVRRADGSVVDVDLDANLQRLGAEVDDVEGNREDRAEDRDDHGEDRGDDDSSDED
jgi:uncharacterized membrane protein YkoI